MSLEDKYKALSTLIEEHNSHVTEEYKIDATHVVHLFKITGGTSEDRLRGLSYEDILQILPSPGTTAVKPIMLAKAIAKIFRGNEQEGPKDEAGFVPSKKKVETLSYTELLESLDLRDPESHVAKRLNHLSGGAPFIVLMDDKVDVKVSRYLLDEIRSGFPARDVVENSQGKQCIPRKVTDKLPVTADENPLYPGRALRPDGTCDQLNRSWTGIPFETRVIVHLAKSLGEISGTHEANHHALDVALAGKAAERFPRAAALYEQKAKTGDTPRLKVTLNQPSTKNGSVLDQGTKVKF